MAKGTHALNHDISVIYKAYGETVDEIRTDDITVSLIREKKPNELFDYFKRI